MTVHSEADVTTKDVLVQDELDDIETHRRGNCKVYSINWGQIGSIYFNS